MADNLTYTIVINDSGTATIKKVAAEAKAAGDTLSQELGVKPAKELKKATEEVSEFDRTLARLQRTAIAFIGMWALTKVVSGFSAVVGEGIKFNSLLEDSKLGIASILVASGDFYTSTGKTLQGWDKMNAAISMAGDLMEEVKVKNLETFATLEQITKAYQSGLAFGLQRGFNPQQMLSYTVAMVQAAGALRMNLDMMAEELRSLMTGAISPRTSFIATALKFTPDDIRKYQNDIKAFMAFIMDRLSAFSYAGILSQSTWTGLASNVKDAFSNILGEGFRSLFEYLKDQLVGTQGYIVQIDEVTKKMRLNPDLLEDLKVTSAAFIGLLETIKAVGSALGVLKDIASPVTTGLGWFVDNLYESLYLIAEMAAKGQMAYEEAVKRIMAGVEQARSKYKEFSETAQSHTPTDINDLASGHDTGLKYVGTPRKLSEDEMDYLLKAGAETGKLNDQLKLQLQEKMSLRGVSVDLSKYSGQELQAVVKLVKEYENLKETGVETQEAFANLLANHLAIARVEMNEAPKRIAEQVAKTVDDYEAQKEAIIGINKYEKEKLDLTNKGTEELKRQMDIQTALAVKEVDWARRSGAVDRAKTLVETQQKYAEITDNINAQLALMERQTTLEVQSLMIQAEKTKDMDKFVDQWDQILALMKLSNEQMNQLSITGPEKQKQPVYAAGMTLAEAKGDMAEYARLSEAATISEMKVLAATQKMNPELWKMIEYKWELFKINEKIKEAEMAVYGSNMLQQAVSQYGALVGNVQLQNAAEQILLENKFRVLDADDKIGGEERESLKNYLRITEAAQAQLRVLDQYQSALDLRSQFATLMGDWGQVNELEKASLEIQRQSALIKFGGMEGIDELINKLYDLKVELAEAKKNMDIFKLSDLGTKAYALKTANDLADSYQNMLPKSIDTATSSIHKFYDDLTSGTMSAGQAFSNLFTNFTKGIADMILGIAELILKIEILKALGYGGGTGTGLGGMLGLLGGIVGLAGGGIVNEPMIAKLGEGGRREAVVPLDQMGGMGLGGKQMTYIDNRTYQTNNIDAIDHKSIEDRVTGPVISGMAKVKNKQAVQTLVRSHM